ncbi:hypothetical protein FRB93_013565 [Tulasnella sp. JGI-2019a]|nr:hypothetical protein FRB93_013565 [Tulasnella sp. JGI-2019a]
MLVLPVLLTVVNIAGSIWIVYDDSVAATRLEDFRFTTTIFPVTITVFAMNISTTWYLTACICYKL